MAYDKYAQATDLADISYHASQLVRACEDYVIHAVASGDQDVITHAKTLVTHYLQRPLEGSTAQTPSFVRSMIWQLAGEAAKRIAFLDPKNSGY